MPIFDHLSKIIPGLDKWPGDYGIEIETESKKEYEIPRLSFWDVHQDGSLRDFGQEYVLKVPVSYADNSLQQALDEFNDKTKNIKFVEDSVTTSVHVHMNFLNDEWITLCNFFTLYSLTENLLIRYSGPTRTSNGFCLPMCDSEDNFKNICRIVKTISNLDSVKELLNIKLPPNENKYAALNVSSLAFRGSLEQRSFRGTTDIKEIYKWVSILDCIKTYSKTKGLDPIKIVKDFDARGSRILDDVFLEYRKDISHLDENMLMEKNFWYAGQIAYSSKDWSKVGEVKEKAPSKKSRKDLNKISRVLYGVDFNELSDANVRAVLATFDDNLALQEDRFNTLTNIARQATGSIRRSWAETVGDQTRPIPTIEPSPIREEDDEDNF